MFRAVPNLQQSVDASARIYGLSKCGSPTSDFPERNRMLNRVKGMRVVPSCLCWSTVYSFADWYFETIGLGEPKFLNLCR